MDLTRKLWERPTPKFYRRGASCDRAGRRILLLASSLGDWAHPDGKKKLQNWLKHSQKKMAAVWAGHINLILDFSLSAHVLQRKPLPKPAQKQAVILYANKRVKYDLDFRS
jgi:hypothetical protein